MEEYEGSTSVTQDSSYSESMNTLNGSIEAELSTNGKNTSKTSTIQPTVPPSFSRKFLKYSLLVLFLSYLIQLSSNSHEIYKPIRHWGFKLWWWNLLRSHFKLFGYEEPYSLLFSPEELSNDYDFIVIGGGAAGSVVASGLSDKNSSKVLLLEAGGPTHSISLSRYYVPATVHLSQGSDLDWKYKTVPQDHANQSLNNKQSKWPSGKGLGGSSILNYMLWVRGDSSDFDSWEKHGATGWSFNDVLPYFQKIEKVLNLPFIFNHLYRGSSGKIPVTRVGNLNPNEKAFISAALELGYEYNDDYNSKKLTGASIFQANIHNGWRMTPFHTYISAGPSKKSSLHVLPYAHVTKINFDQNKKAESVSFAFLPPKTNPEDAKTHTVSTKKEVILSAGAIKSPQILMLSGIGPKEHLTEIGIDVIADLPGVGKNLQDHLFGFLPSISKPGMYVSMMKLLNPLNLMNYLFRGSGTLASSGCNVQLITEDLSDKQNDNEQFTNESENENSEVSVTPFPDIQIIFYSGVLDMRFLGPNFNLPPELHQIWKHYNGSKHLLSKMVLFLPTLLHPRSTGSILLKSPNGLDNPEIQPNYLTHPRDLEILIKGLEISYNLSKSPAFGDILYDPITFYCHGASLPPELREFCQGELVPGTYEYFKKIAQHFSFTLYHPIGTCKMGNSKDFAHHSHDTEGKNTNYSVTDENLLVCGGNCVKGLRVVDGSVMPHLTSGNTHAPIIMIAEKAVDLIKKTWSNDFTLSPD